jgi:hypothetical protein
LRSSGKAHLIHEKPVLASARLLVGPVWPKIASRGYSMILAAQDFELSSVLTKANFAIQWNWPLPALWVFLVSADTPDGEAPARLGRLGAAFSALPLHQ